MREKNGKIIECKQCQKSFYIPKWRLKKAKFCSMRCYQKSTIGRKCSEETKQKIRISHKGKKYKPMSEEGRQNISNAKKGKIGCQANNWQGGEIIHQGKYILIHKPSHPFCDGKGYVRRSRLVMEKHLGRYLTKKEVMHHINGIRDDDRIENLMLFSNHSKHMKFHHSRL